MKRIFILFLSLLLLPPSTLCLAQQSDNQMNPSPDLSRTAVTGEHFEQEAGHYWGQAWSGFEEYQTDNNKKYEHFYYNPATYVRMLGEPTVDELKQFENYSIYSAMFYPSFHGYVSIRMMLDQENMQGWIVTNRGNNGWYAGAFKLFSHSVYYLTAQEVEILIPSMDQAFSQGMEEEQVNTGGDGMDIVLMRIENGKADHFTIWSPRRSEFPAVYRLLQSFMDYAHCDADYLYEYLELNKPQKVGELP